MPIFRFLSFMVLSLASAMAQAPVPPSGPAKPLPPPSPPGRAGLPVPGGAAAAPGGRKPGIPIGENKINEPIEKPILNGAELATLYRKYTGRRVILSSAAAAAEFSFVQDASPEDPLTYAQAADLLKKAAAIENFVFMPDEKDTNLDILTVATRPPGFGYDVFNENTELPEGDSVITYIMTFKHIKPAIAAQAFRDIIGAFGTYGSIAPLNGSVAITENTSLIRRLIKLKEEIDVPEDVIKTLFISVKYSDVTELAATINELINAQQQGQQKAANAPRSAPTAAPGVPGAPQQIPGAATAGGNVTATDTPIQVMPEPRTNRIFAMGRPVDVTRVEGLIREFDIETSEKTFLRRKLRFLTVSDFLPIAEDALNRAFTSTGDGGAKPPGAGTGGAAAGRSGSTRSSNTRSSNSRSSTSSNRNTGTGTNTSFGGGNSSFGGGMSSGGMGGGGMGGGGSSLNNTDTSTAPESRLVGRTLLVADNITNSIIVQGPPSGLEIIIRLLDQVDVKADQVLISTVIGQLALDDSKEFGVDYLFRNGDKLVGRGGGGSGLGGADSPALLPIDPATALAPGSLAGSSGLRLYGKIGDLTTYLKAMQSKANFTVLARPSIYTANNQRGMISTGTRVGIPTGSNSYSAGGASTQIQYQDVVLKLEVIPLINSEKEITLQISLIDDEQSATPQIISGGGANGGDMSVPNITTRELITTVTIPNNETIVLGGLIKTSMGDSVSGIPILGSIPFLGKIFSTTKKSKKREELLVFLQPSIIRNRNSLDAAQIAMDRRYKVTDEVRAFADGPGILPPKAGKAPITNKGNPPKAKPVAEPKPVSSKMKTSIRPAYRQ